MSSGIGYGQGGGAPTPASGSDITTGTDNTKMVTAKALADAGIRAPIYAIGATDTDSSQVIASGDGEVQLTSLDLTLNAGIYLVLWHVRFYASGGGTCEVRCYNNGVQNKNLSTAASGGDFASADGLGIVTIASNGHHLLLKGLTSAGNFVIGEKALVALRIA